MFKTEHLNDCFNILKTLLEPCQHNLDGITYICLTWYILKNSFFSLISISFSKEMVS